MGLALIKEIYRKKSEERERIRVKVIEDVFDALKELTDEVYFKEAYIFGSVIQPFQFGEYSDIDIAFKGLDKDELFYAVGFLSRYLARDVNIVHIENVYFRDKILRTGIRWKRD